MISFPFYYYLEARGKDYSQDKLRKKKETLGLQSRGSSTLLRTQGQKCPYS